jgi:kynurenine formamidase
MQPFNLIDLSHPLSIDTPTYPGDPSFAALQTRTVGRDGYSLHEVSLGSHTGTHLDAPYHFIPSGRKVDEIPLQWLVGQPVIVDLSGLVGDRQEIGWDVLESHEARIKEACACSQADEGGRILLLRTGWSEHWGKSKYYDHPFLSRDAASKLLDCGIRVLGVDMPSPDQTPSQQEDALPHTGYGVHEEILGRDGVIVENLTNLEGLVGGGFVVSLVPINLEGCDGAPVRAFAWDASISL